MQRVNSHCSLFEPKKGKRGHELWGPWGVRATDRRHLRTSLEQTSLQRPLEPGFLATAHLSSSCSSPPPPSPFPLYEESAPPPTEGQKATRSPCNDHQAAEAGQRWPCGGQGSQGGQAEAAPASATCVLLVFQCSLTTGNGALLFAQLSFQ